MPMYPAFPPLLPPSSTDASADFIGVLLTVIVPVLMGLLATSDKARQATQAVLSIYNFIHAFSERNKPKPKAQTAPTNGNGNGHTNGSIQSDLLKSVMQTIRSESDARESGDDVMKAELRETKERVRRDVDNLYMVYSDLSRDAKKHDEAIKLLNVETAAIRAELVRSFKNDEEMNTKLDTILHYVQPPQPTPPGNEIIALDDNDLEAVG